MMRQQGGMHGARSTLARHLEHTPETHRLKTALIEAGITVGLTTLAGALLTVVTFGASDEVAAADAPTVEAVEAETTEVQSAVDGELGGEGSTAPKAVTEPPQQVTKFDTNHFAGQRLTAQHFNDHAAEFGYQTEEEYVQGASNFLKEAQAKGLPARISPDGTVRVYDASTNTFASYNSQTGVIRTFFKPSSPTYWTRNSPDWGAPVQWR